MSTLNFDTWPEFKLIKRLVIDLVADLQGCKLTELIVEVLSAILEKKIQDIISISDHDKLLIIEIYNEPQYSRSNIILELIEHMIDTGDLICINYELNKLPDRIKSFVLPPDTKNIKLLNNI